MSLENVSKEQIVDMKIVDFGQMCSGFDVNQLSLLKNVVSSALGEINVKLGQLLHTKYININMTEDEYKQFASNVASMGGLISNINSKVEIIDYYLFELTPDCFKNPKLDNN